MPAIDTEALILKSADSGETSRRLTLFSRDEGKFSLVARGARSKSGRAHATLEPYAIVRVFANLKPDADLGTLSRGEVVEHFGRLRDDLTRLAAAGVLSEVVERAAQPRLANPRLYDYSVSFLRALDAEAPEKVVFLLSHALLRATQALGLAPELGQCVGCGRKSTARADVAAGVERGVDARWIGFAAGGLLCAECRGRGATGPGAPVEPAVGALLRTCATRPWSQARAAASDGPATRALFTLILRWVSYHLETEIKSARFLDSVLRI